MKGAICILLLPVLVLSGCMEPAGIPDAIPQERMRWQNPYGYELGPPPSDRGRWQNPHGWGMEPYSGYSTDGGWDCEVGRHYTGRCGLCTSGGNGMADEDGRMEFLGTLVIKQRDGRQWEKH